MTDTKVKHAEKLGKIEDYLAPWETAAGEIEIDKPRLKRYLFSVLLDAAKRADRAEEAESKITAAEKEATEAKAELAKGDSTGKIASLEADLATAKSDGAKTADELLKIKVGAEAGLNVKQSLRLQGDDEDALKDDAKELVATFGSAKQESDDDDDDDDEDEDEDEASLTRVTRLNNPADSRTRENEKDGPVTETDFLKAVSGIGNRSFV